jgi:protein TonB
MSAGVLGLAADDRAELLRWGSAGLVIAAAHGALIAGYLLLHRPDRPAAGAPVVLVELAPVASASETAPLDMPVEQEAPQPPEPETEVPKEELPPPIEPPKVEVPALPSPTAPPLPQRRVEPKKQPKPRASQVTRAPARSTAPAAPQFGVSSAEANAAQASWRDRLVAHLQRHKRYPAGAQARREQGVAVLDFSMDRNGRVLSSRIARSSGVAELDAEVLAMIQRAQPLPPFPPSMTQGQMSLSVPLRFSLQ